MSDDNPLGAADSAVGDNPLGLSGQSAAEGAGHAERAELSPGLAWVSPLVQQVARLRTACVYELLLFVYADGRRGLTVRNAKKPYRLERL